MSRGWWAALAAVCAAGFLLRAGVAVLDARRPFFPPHYYNDERDYLRSSEALTPGKELHTAWLALLARAAGPGPLPGRLAAAAAGAGAAAFWGWSAAALASPAGGLAAAAFLSAWPSNAFHTAMAHKEAPVALLTAACVAAFFAGLAAGDRRRQACFAAAAAAALLLAMLRPHLAALLAAAAALAAAAPRAARAERGAVLLGALWLAAGWAAHWPLKRAVIDARYFPGAGRPTDPGLTAHADPYAPGVRLGPSLEAVTAYREARLAGMRDWSLRQTGREPESVLFAQRRLRSLGDLVLFVPQASFYELFMPLPGLYPLEGKPGRMLAAAEGLVLLGAALAAAWGARRASWTPRALFLAAFLALAVPLTAFFESDLGAASRHRIHLIPFMLPFAAVLLAARRREAP